MRMVRILMKIWVHLRSNKEVLFVHKWQGKPVKYYRDDVEIRGEEVKRLKASHFWVKHFLVPSTYIFQWTTSSDWISNSALKAGWS